MNKTSDPAVVDASYILSLLLPDEDSQKNLPGKMFAPNLLDYEIINALRSAIMRKRISSKIATELFAEYQNLPIARKTVNFARVLELSIKHQISTYDASYLILASELGIELRTLDKQLAKLVL